MTAQRNFSVDSKLDGECRSVRFDTSTDDSWILTEPGVVSSVRDGSQSQPDLASQTKPLVSLLR